MTRTTTPAASERSLLELRDLALAAARAGGAAALAHFGDTALAVEEKPDDGGPVTRADREAEEAIRSVVLGARPDDGWLGEETGERTGKSDLVWIVDPVDGTENFVLGRPSWTVLVACEQQGDPRRVVAAAVAQPAARRVWDAYAGGGARCDGAPIHVSLCDDLEASRWAWYTPEWFARHSLSELYAHLKEAGLLEEGRCDADGHVRVAQGLADVVVEPKVAVWDVAATSLVVREAGGRFSDLDGCDDIRGGSAVVTNGRLHDKVLALVSKFRGGY